MIKIIHLKVHRNNFFAIISNQKGKVLFSKNSGSLGFKNSLKSSTEAFSLLLSEVVKFSVAQGKSDLLFKLDAFYDDGLCDNIYNHIVKLLKRYSLKIVGFKVTNRIAHNGCRKRK